MFWRQFGALFRKNWIVLSKHRGPNVWRCFGLPIIYGLFVAVAPTTFNNANNYGLGSSVSVKELSDVFDGSLKLVWSDDTSNASTPSPSDVVAQMTKGFTQKQLQAITRVDTVHDIPQTCPQNFNLFSECFAAVAFNQWDQQQLNYTILADGGLVHIDVVKHASDIEKRILPLQWAIDRAIIELSTGTRLPTPLELPYSQETNKEQNTDFRLDYVRGIRSLEVLLLFVCYIGIAYQLPGAFMTERANLITSHLKAMGLMDSARIISWHLSMSLAYLPAWVIVAIAWRFLIFTSTNVALILLVHLVLGLSLASWSLFIAIPFGKSPSLAAVASTFLAFIFATLALVLKHASSTAAVFFTLLFPPGYYVFAIRAITGFEAHQLGTNVVKPDPDNNMRLLPVLFAAIIDIFLWPWLAILLESYLYDAKDPQARPFWAFWRRKQAGEFEDASPPPPPGTAISLRNIGKDFQGARLLRKKNVVAISDLSLDIPKHGIYVLLGSNGAGKSTTMSIIGGLLGRTRGTVKFEGGTDRPPRGTIGLVPQKNVLFSELTCFQTLQLWRAVKRGDNPGEADEDIEQLLRDCDLGHKIHFNADALSGGQKRKLQLAIGLVGGSKILLVDECTSGVDPLSRRSIWKTLSSVRHDRTIVFTTHFLDEADLLADSIAVLAQKGKLVAQGTPVSLKSNLGEGYTVDIKFHGSNDVEKNTSGSESSQDLLKRIRSLAPLTYTTSPSPNNICYHLKAKDPSTVRRVLQLVDHGQEVHNIASYSVLGTSIEDVFLGLMHDSEVDSEGEGSQVTGQPNDHPPAVLELTNGRRRRSLGQALTIFHKRILIARRSWLTPFLTILVAVLGSCIPLVFLKDSPSTCTDNVQLLKTSPAPLYLPISWTIGHFSDDSSGIHLLAAPSGAISDLGSSASVLQVTNVSDNTSFVDTINQTYRNQSLGGVSVDFTSGNALFAWEGSGDLFDRVFNDVGNGIVSFTTPKISASTMLNLADNILYNHALNSSDGAGTGPRIIVANYQIFPGVSGGPLYALKWIAFFGAAMGLFPAFFSLYVAAERRSQVQAMQLSNGLASPIGLWLGHLMFDSLISLAIATIVIIVFAATSSDQFNALGFFWVVLVLYGIVGALFSYCVSLIFKSPLAAFSASAGYGVVMFVLYLVAYLATFAYAKTSNAADILTIIHFAMSTLSPVASVLRAGFVSTNLFALLCDGTKPVTTSSLGDIRRFGGPIVYLVVYGLTLFCILVWVDSGSFSPRRLFDLRSPRRKPGSTTNGNEMKQDVKAESEAVAASEDSLRVLCITKTFSGSTEKVLDDVSFGVGTNTIFALLGPNGAGKTTSFNIIRGQVIPDGGDVVINGVSVLSNPKSARLSLGVCPQFTAIDSQLSVREHLMIYGRLKGLYRGEELHRNVEDLMRATSLHSYADRLASKLSGGNQRKLSLAIALIGNPRCILIDEFSTGVDAKMKREMWSTLRHVAVGKSVIITTHSMEEASALATKVGILAKKMLAVGTTDSLASRYPAYEVHISCRTLEDVTRAKDLMLRVPGCRMADDVATRFEVPVGKSITLPKLFSMLANQGSFTEYTVERASLESAFLKVIRENDVLEEDRRVRKRSKWRCCCCC